MTILRGQIYYADLDPSLGSEQGGVRPVLVIQNDIGNRHSPTLIVAALTGQIYTKHSLPTHLLISSSVGLKIDSIVLLEQIRTIDRMRLLGYVGKLDESAMRIVDERLLISLGISVPILL
ncbi:MAG: type II toxin-antitoxin system PemK/MazF family toxin [Erysipelotrichaceae bacterium]